MCMNFKFSRGYGVVCGECRAFQPAGVCCYSNTNSTEMLLEQQRATVRMSDSGGLKCFLR
jgi:hypothetical protein